MAAFALLVAAAGIYPADHWKYSTKLTVGSFDNFVKEQVDSGKTLFAPAWNSITKAFAGNDKVSFGDVNLAEEQIRKGNPGEGGWPTVRYFNKETGYEGKSYTQKTSKAMCDELGDENYMQAYVEEAGGVLLCSTFDCLCARREGGACSKKEIDYYEKNRGTDVKAKLKLLSGSLEKATKKDEWMSQRISILKLIDATATSEGTKQEL